jgi:hypothetical protein
MTPNFFRAVKSLHGKRKIVYVSKEDGSKINDLIDRGG